MNAIYSHRCGHVPQWEFEAASAAVAGVIELVMALCGIEIPEIGNGSYARLERVGLQAAYIYHHVVVHGLSADTVAKDIHMPRIACVRTAQAIIAGPRVYNFPGQSDLKRAIAAALEEHTSLKPRKGQADALVALDDRLDALALDREFSLTAEERQLIIREWAQQRLQQGVVAGSWLVRAAYSREPAKGDAPSYLYPPEVRHAVAGGRYVAPDMTLDDIGDCQAPIGSAAGGRPERMLFGWVGWETTERVCWILLRLAASGYLPDVIIVDGHAAYRAVRAGLLRTGLFISVWISPFGKMHPAERLHGRRRDHLTIAALQTHTSLALELAEYEYEHGVDPAVLGWRKITQAEGCMVQWWPITNRAIRRDRLNYLGSTYTVPSEFTGTDQWIGYDRKRHVVGILELEFGHTDESLPSMQGPIRSVRVLHEQPAKGTPRPARRLVEDPFTRYPREMEEFLEAERKRRDRRDRGRDRRDRGRDRFPIDVPPIPPIDDLPVDPPPPKGQDPNLQIPPVGGDPDVPPPPPIVPPKKGDPDLGEMMRQEYRNEVGERADWEKVPGLLCSVDDAEGIRTHAQNLNLMRTAGQNKAQQQAAKARWPIGNETTRLQVFSGVTAPDDQLIGREECILKAPPGRGPIPWTPWTELFRWVTKALKRARLAAPTDRRKAVEELESISSHLEQLSVETDVSCRAMQVLSRVNRARNDLLHGKVNHAIRSIQSAEAYLLR